VIYCYKTYSDFFEGVAMKKVLKIVLIVIGVIILAAAGLFGWLTVTEYRPDAVEELEVQGAAGWNSPKLGEKIDILSWNIGYAGLGKDEDFFMDGGVKSRPDSKEAVETYLRGIYQTAYSEKYNFDIVLMQEVDTDSHRTYGINEMDYLGVDAYTYALNHSCGFVPIPIPPIGKVHAGLMTQSTYLVESAKRISLPCPFGWPSRTANLKRCLMATYIPIEDSDKQLVLVNLHLEAYDSGEGKIAQTKVLKEFILSEYEKGNYVIAGGDFNQTFPGALDLYPVKNSDLWAPGTLTEDIMPEGWQLEYDISTPTCRLLNQPYDPSDENTQYFVIDGFIISPNVTVEKVETLDIGFEYSDHNPVSVKVILGEGE